MSAYLKMSMQEDRSNGRRIHPKMFTLWLSLGSMVMLFAAFSSAYLVREAAGNWLEFRLPRYFFISTLVLLLSSVVLHFSLRALKVMHFSSYRIGVLLALVLGVAFLILQYYGWMDMFERGIDLKANPSGSFVYLISGVHALHVFGGLVILVIASIQSWILPDQISPQRILRFEMTNTYWHFVDILWVYLLLLFILV